MGLIPLALSLRLNMSLANSTSHNNACFYQRFICRIYSAAMPSDHNDICALADSIGVKRNYIIKLASQMAKQIESSLPKAVEDATTKLEYSEKVMVERMVHEIDSILKKTKKVSVFSD